MSKNNLNLRALLLAGGFGTRLMPLTEHTPKCLVNINGKPLLEYWLSTLFDAGFERVLINTHHLSKQVESYCSMSQYKSKIDLVYETQLLGTAGTLRANRHYFGQTFLMAHADNFTVFNMKSFLNRHRKRPNFCIATMMTFHTDSPSDCGIVEIDERNILVGYEEKVANPSGNIANAAVFLLEKESLTLLDSDPSATDFCKDIVPLGIGKFQIYTNSIYHRDIGTIKSLEQANRDFPHLAVHIK